MRIALRRLVLVLAALVTIGCDRVTKHAATEMLAGEAERSYLGDIVRLGYRAGSGQSGGRERGQNGTRLGRPVDRFSRCLGGRSGLVR